MLVTIVTILCPAMNTLVMDNTSRRLNHVAKYSNSPHAQHITRREDDGAAEQTQVQRGQLATTNYHSTVKLCVQFCTQ